MALEATPEFWLLALHTLPGVRMARVARILEVLHRHQAAPETFFRESPDLWRKKYDLPAPVVHYLEHHVNTHLSRTRELMEWLRRNDVWFLTYTDPRYPPEFRTLPYRVPLIYGRGPQGLWAQRPRIAFLNSRFLREDTAALLREAAAAVLRDLKVCVVTSPFRAAYRACAEEAVQAGCPVILVGDRGIRMLLESRWVRRLAGSQMLITPSAPDDMGTPGSGMIRDDLIGTLADVLVGFEIYEGGNMERQFLRGLETGKVVLLWDRHGRDLANPRLLRRGAVPFRTLQELLARLRDELGL